ncbi:LysR substrate-binding domain-containing protein [Edwardsiella tarda]|uniref:LysR substrate-binding domain-containing protein n=1 Tax=Edwardsiella tarda TaxID=636 RepID=UPI001967B7FD|nr:LysR substrate-binding domain-containing protein [Edwardsiella tarda]
MRINLEVLLILDALDRHGSFAAAAQSLYKTPAALSYMVQKLESNLNLQLLDRSGHRARFTPAGRIILDKGRHLLSEAHALEQQALLLESGWETEIVVALEGYTLPEILHPAITDFLSQHPHTRLHLAPALSLPVGLAGHDTGADIIIGTAARLPERGGYVYQALGVIETLLVAAPHHPLAQSPTPLTPGQLGQHRTIEMGERLDQPAITHTQEARQASLVVYDIYCQISLLLNGVGIGYLPYHIARRYLTQQTLIACPLSVSPAHEIAYIGWRAAKSGRAMQWWRERLLSGELRTPLGYA